MKKNISFVANDRPVNVEVWPGSPALDFIRGQLGLTGTKEGCREGDCGACAVLLGSMERDGLVHYRTAPSCLLAMGELDHHHLLTIEGLSSAAAGTDKGITPVMRAFLEENASQCGFCSPGFIISLTGWLMESAILDVAGAVVAVEGNLCRCTGYGAIRRAAEALVAEFAGLPPPGPERLRVLAGARVIPSSVLDFLAAREFQAARTDGADAGEAQGGSTELESPENASPSRDSVAARIEAFLPPAGSGAPETDRRKSILLLGGGTDWYVRNPEPEETDDCFLLDLLPPFHRIARVADREGQPRIEIGEATTIREFFASPLLRAAVPGLENFEQDFASSLIRNRATVGGNVCNASPVADMTAILIGLGATVTVGTPGAAAYDASAPETGNGVSIADASPLSTRTFPLEKLFKGYKSLDLNEGEIVEAFGIVPLTSSNRHVERFNFEKIAKRRSLDIAAVNTACRIAVDSDGTILRARLSAGGVGPTPLYLEKASAFLEGKRLSTECVAEAADIAVSETCPISDVRGSAEYRKRLLRRLIIAHFIRLFPDDSLVQELLP